MDYATELYGILSLYFTGNKSRVKCLTNILIGLLKAANTNLTQVAKNMPGSIKTSSKYRRIQRFFSEITLDCMTAAHYVLSQLPNSSQFTLIIDRTNWKIGEVNINFLVLAIAFKGISLPLFWYNLNRAGNSNTIERMQMLSSAVQLISIDKIEVLLADREFIGEDWLHWLDNYGIKFVIRIRDNSILETSNKTRKAIKSFRTLTRGCCRYMSCRLWGLDITVAGYKDEGGNVHILATNGTPETALEKYNLRWQIESMFLCLKSKGFFFESCGMTCQKKLDTLFGLLAILTSLNCKVGSWFNTIKPIKIKNHSRPAIIYLIMA